MDIEKAVRKSFHSTSPLGTTTPPILLEGTTLPPLASYSPLKLDMISAAAMDARAWTAASTPDYEGRAYESEDGVAQPGERVRQGSKAMRVEVVTSPRLEGVAGRVSGESVRGGGGKGGIVLV